MNEIRKDLVCFVNQIYGFDDYLQTSTEAVMLGVA